MELAGTLTFAILSAILAHAALAAMAQEHHCFTQAAAQFSRESIDLTHLPPDACQLSPSDMKIVSCAHDHENYIFFSE